jgi:hypothetical protein
MSTENSTTRKSRLYWFVLAIMVGAFVAVALNAGVATGG